MKVLAFDTAISTGVCFGAAGEKPRAWVVNLGKADWDVRFSRCLRMVDHYVSEFRPDLVAVEAPAAGGLGNPDLIGLTVCVRAQAARRGIPVMAYYPNSIRKHFLGKALQARDFPGRSKAAAKGQIKAQVVARCQMLGWDIEAHDAADAAALWDYACAMQSRAHQVTSLGGLFAEGAA